MSAARKLARKHFAANVKAKNADMAVDKAYANAYKFERRIQLAVLRQLMVFYCLTLHNDLNQTIIDETGIDVLARAQVISMPPDGSE